MHLFGKELENIVMMMVARTMEAVETELMRPGATVASQYGVGRCGDGVFGHGPTVTAATYGIWRKTAAM